MSMQNTPFALRKTLHSSRIFCVVELVLILIFIWATEVGHIRVPTLTIPLLLVGWLSLRVRGMGWRDVGLRRVDNWKRTTALAFVIAFVHQMFSSFVLIPTLEGWTGEKIDLSILDQIRGNFMVFLASLVVAWLLAGFGEELVNRGYLLNRFADLIPSEPARWVFATVVTSSLFGVMHSYQGIIGMVDTGISALVMCGLYFFAGRNLWLPILKHGFYDTIIFFMVFVNWY